MVVFAEERRDLRRRAGRCRSLSVARASAWRSSGLSKGVMSTRMRQHRVRPVGATRMLAWKGTGEFELFGVEAINRIDFTGCQRCKLVVLIVMIVADFIDERRIAPVVETVSRSWCVRTRVRMHFDATRSSFNVHGPVPSGFFQNGGT